VLSDAKFARGFPRCGDRRLLTWRQGRKAQPCTRGGSFYQGNNGLFGFARDGVEIAQGAKRLDQPVVVVCFPNGGIDPQLRHRLAIEAPVQAPLLARRLEGTCDLGDLRGTK